MLGHCYVSSIEMEMAVLIRRKQFYTISFKKKHVGKQIIINYCCTSAQISMLVNHFMLLYMLKNKK